MKILVTGSLGAVGNPLSQELRRRGHEVVAPWVPTSVSSCCGAGSGLRPRTKAEYWSPSSIGRSFFEGLLLEGIRLTSLASRPLQGKAELME